MGANPKRGVERLKTYETDRLWLTAWLKGLSLPQKIFVCYSYGMAEEATVRRYSSLDEMKADEYRYWQSRPGHERLDAVEELIETAYALKGGRRSRMNQDYKDLCPPSMPMALNTSS
jgi:hypothetical protein